MPPCGRAAAPPAEDRDEAAQDCETCAQTTLRRWREEAPACWQNGDRRPSASSLQPGQCAASRHSDIPRWRRARGRFREWRRGNFPKKWLRSYTFTSYALCLRRKHKNVKPWLPGCVGSCVGVAWEDAWEETLPGWAGNALPPAANFASC